MQSRVRTDNAGDGATQVAPGGDVVTARRSDRLGPPAGIVDEAVRGADATDPELADLVDCYYRHVPPEDLIDEDVPSLLSTVTSHLELARQRPPGRPAVRVVNPPRSADAWRNGITELQIVTDDMPYLLDSVLAELSGRGLTVLRAVHPILVVRRKVTGELTTVLCSAQAGAPPPGSLPESWMQLLVTRVGDDQFGTLRQRLVDVLNDVREVVEDADRMCATATGLAADLHRDPPAAVAPDDVSEAVALLRWLADGHFTFLGYRHYSVIDDPAAPGGTGMRAVLGSGLGVLRRDSLASRGFSLGGLLPVPAHPADDPPPTGAPARAGQPPAGQPPAGPAARRTSPELLILTHASAVSTVYRRVYPYYIGVQTFDATGGVTGEHRFLGMLSSTALHENVLDIPVIRHKVARLLDRAGLPMHSYSGQQMLEVLQTYPRAELFSTDLDALCDIVTGVLALRERRRLRLFLRRDPYGRFYSALVFLPRDRYTTTSRLRMQEVLLRELAGSELDYNTRVTESQLARVLFTVRTPDAATPQADAAALQDKLTDAIRTWEDLLGDALRDGATTPVVGVDAAPDDLVSHYLRGLPEGYKEAFSPAEALTDLRNLERLAAIGPPGDASTPAATAATAATAPSASRPGAARMSADDVFDMALYTPRDAEPGVRRFKLYLRGHGVSLAQVLPVLSRMGVEVLDERPYLLTREDSATFWVYDFGLRLPSTVAEYPTGHHAAELGRRFADAFDAAWRGRCEVDGFSALVVRAGLTWREAMVLRAYAKYLRQAGIPFSQDYIEDVLLAHTPVADALVELFRIRFDPALSDEERLGRGQAWVSDIAEMIDAVSGLDADRILRSYLRLISASTRTSYFLTGPDGRPAPYLSIKLDPQAISELPLPRPRFEIFVYAPRTEGVHLRFGPVARGGLRWSDRREDYRTEILGLAKAQAVKNAVIVPMGAKGGFVVKRPPEPTGDPRADREATQAEAIACYRMFIAGLLDLTDNLVDGQVVPCGSIRHDGDDTYLVVAADKGTATFSDIANEVSLSRGFWLGDAFASGGSAGYDHKVMGITARGAWESVARHFRELGTDIQREPFTVVGVGDMSGDVFGNGMLLSRQITLLAAFDHRHVFLDPDPDPATSYAERERMFALPRSSWDDYDRSVISAGGGVWSRTLKVVPIAEPVRVALGLPDGVTELSPPELIRAILLAPADLLFNGGIGTYVKASTEGNADVGDKANDAVRVNGAALRAKVVGEGGNLGLTQRGRIEFARAGGRVNTDAMDNSAGVDCSDHEVNIKILLDRLVAQGELAEVDRTPLLEGLTDEVAALVLADNHAQNEALGTGRAHAVGMCRVHARLVDSLVTRRDLNRELEVLPGPDEFAALVKAGDGLSSPELATLMAHVKLDLTDELVRGDLPSVEAFARRLPGYFPQPLAKRFGPAIREHPLRREITTTLLVNEMVDCAGVSYAFRLGEEVGAEAADAVRAFTVTTSVFRLHDFWQQVRDLDGTVASAVQDNMVLESRRLLDRASRWLLSNRPQPLQAGAEIARFGPVVAALAPRIGELLRGPEADSVTARTNYLTGLGVAEPLARRAGELLYLYGLLDVREVTELGERDRSDGAADELDPMEVAKLYFAVSEHLAIDRMLISITALERGNRWHALARLALRDDVYGSLRAITLDVLRTSDGAAPEHRIGQWEQANASRLARSRATLRDIAGTGRLDLAALSVATRQLRTMVR
jgi:glutamate dehydrogenase